MLFSGAHGPFLTTEAAAAFKACHVMFMGWSQVYSTPGSYQFEDWYAVRFCCRDSAY